MHRFGTLINVRMYFLGLFNCKEIMVQNIIESEMAKINIYLTAQEKRRHS